MDEKISYIDESIQKQYQEGISYIKKMGFMNNWPLYEKFKAGDQWAKPTEATKNLPRPVFNIIDYIENHKIASVFNESIKMIFNSQEIGEDEELQNAILGADKFTKYSETTWENIQQDLLNEEMLESASNLGTGILHYYWDTSIKGGVVNQWIGDIAGESIDPINVFFGNPQQKRVQKQPYIIISSREIVSNVKDIAKANNVPLEYIERIKSDKETENEGYVSAKLEIDSISKCTVLTKYFKQNNTVWFIKTVGDVVIFPKTDTGLKLYPIVVMPWKTRKKSIYGIGDTEGLIPNQKGINFLLAMMLLSAQDNAWPKLLAKNGALKQQITNTPGEIITDYNSQPGIDGVKYMQPGRFDPIVMSLVDKFVDLTKTFSGAQDAAVGETPGSQLNASAIMLLQKAAGVPIESIKKRFYRAMEDTGRIWEEFWKAKYNIDRKVMIKDDEGKDSMIDFNGENYKDIPFNLKIDIGPAGTYSESLAQSTLDRLYDKGDIGLNLFLKYSPKSAMPFKDSLMKDLEQQRIENEQMQRQMALTQTAQNRNPNIQNGAPM